ncbi:MAG: ABC transporter permease subunit, partial [Anaerolineae bacterium]|nr:ABC transporter permease subunit [Anaerolineae bacterium]
DGEGNLVWQDTDGTNVKALDIYGTGDNARAIVGTEASRLTIYSRSGQTLLETYLDYAIADLAVTANGARIAVGTMDGSVTLVHGGNGSVLWQVSVGRPVQGIAITRGGENILVGTDAGRALLFDAEGQLLQTFEQTDELLDVALSSDGNMLAFATADGHSQLQDQQVAATAAQTTEARRNQTVYGMVGLLVVSTVAAGWSIRYTEGGKRFWQEGMAGPRQLLRRIWRSRLSYLFILPTILLLATFNYYPAFSGLYHAFTDWNPGATTEWVGLDNFRYLLQDRFFWTGFLNAVILVVVSVVRIVTVPLLVAELIFHVRHGIARYVFRTLFIVPIVLPMVVQILVWNNIYEPTIGLLNQTLIALGLENWTRVWYGDATVALIAILFIGFPWVDPFALLVFYGGLIGISEEIFDASEVDGASGLKRFWYIDLPLLFGQVRLLVILTFIATVQTFELVFLTTGGGPGASTYTPALELYLMATRLDKLGVASAIGIVLFIIILSGTIFTYRSRRQAAA